MAVIYRSDLENVNTYSEKVLSPEVSETQTVIDSVNSFVSDSPSKLEGKAWNKERKRFQVYTKALEKRKEVSTILKTSVSKANKVMLDYMDGFPLDALNKIPNVNVPKGAKLDMIDSGWVSEFQAALKAAQAAYEAASSSKSGISIKDKVGSALDKAKSAIRGYQSEMDSANAIIAACKEVITYLGLMSAKDAEAYAHYADAEAAISELNVLVTEVDDLFATPTPSSPKVVYVPVGGGTTSTVVDDSSKKPETEETTTDQGNSSGQSTETPTTPQPTPISNTVTTSDVPRPAETNEAPADETPEEELLDEDYVEEEEPVEEGPVIGNDEPIIIENDTSTVVTTQKNDTLRKVGVGLAGAAVAGAVGYGAYKAVKKAKENNEIEEEDENDNYNDYSDDFEIKTNEDDKS